jgi:hypothetical protein
MSGGGGKGGSTTTEVKIPEWLQSAAQGNIRRAEDVAALGNIPYYGPDVAAMTPMQMSAGQGINTAAGAFGLGTNDLSMGMPAPQTFAGGVQGYSSGGLYDQALRELQTRAPGQYNAITGMFINPRTGSTPLSFGQNVPPIAMPNLPAPVSYGDVGGGGGGGGSLAFGAPAGGGSLSGLANTVGSYMPGGVNTRNPDSLLNTIAAGARNAIDPQREPTIANRPVAAPNRPAPKPAPKPAPAPAPTKASVAKFTSSNATSAKSTPTKSSRR